MKANCVVCGKEFKSRQSTCKTCGNECRKALDMERCRQYYEANREKMLESARQYYEANREKLLESARQYREANREKVLESDRQYREANREKLRERCQQYYEANREKVRESQKRHKQLCRAASLLGIPHELYAAMKIAAQFHQQQESHA